MPCLDTIPLDKKLEPQSPEATYMWAYFAWRVLDDKGLQLEKIYPYGEGAGLTLDQRRHAEDEARKMLREFFPEKFAEEETSDTW